MVIIPLSNLLGSESIIGCDHPFCSSCLLAAGFEEEVLCPCCCEKVDLLVEISWAGGWFEMVFGLLQDDEVQHLYIVGP